MIVSVEMVKSKAAELLKAIEHVPCKFCGHEMEIVGEDYIVGRCNHCLATAGKFVCRTCCKSEKELDRAITTIIRMWNGKHSKKLKVPE